MDSRLRRVLEERVETAKDIRRSRPVEALDIVLAVLTELWTEHDLREQERDDLMDAERERQEREK